MITISLVHFVLVYNFWVKIVVEVA